MQNMSLKTIACAVIFVMMAALLGGQPTNPAAVGETVDMVQEVNTDAEPGRSAWLWSRHSLKRHERRLNLIERRHRRRFRRALIRVLPTLLREERRTARRAAIKGRFDDLRTLIFGREIEAQCAVCGVHQDDGFAVDTTLKPAQCIDCFTESEGLRAYAPFICAAVVGLIFAAFAPQWAAFALIGATRQPLPQWAKDGKKKHGLNIRRHGKKKSAQCFGMGCSITIFQGDIKAMLPHGAYTQNKPHCEACAKSHFEELEGRFGGEPSITEPTGRRTEPTPEPTPAPTVPTTTRPPNRKAGQCAVCGVDVAAGSGHIHTESPRGQKVRCADHAENALSEPKTPISVVEPAPSAPVSSDDPAAQIAALLAQLTAGGAVDVDTVRRIVREETAALPAALDEIREAQTQISANALLAVEERLAAITQPTRLEIKKGRKIEPLTPPGVVDHRMLPQFMRTIGALNAKGAPLNAQAIGPAGTGKTAMGERLFEVLKAVGFWDNMDGLPDCATVISCNEEMQPSDLVGRVSPRFFDDKSGAKAGSWAFFEGPALEQFKRPGLLILDEMDTLNPATGSGLNAALANGYITDPDGVRHFRHPRCVVYATANTRGDGATRDYTASHTASLAFLDRFAGARLEVDFDPAIEEAIASPEIVRRIREMRRVAEEQRMSRTVLSYRALSAAEALHQAGWTPEQACAQIAHGFDAARAEVWGYGAEPPILDAAVPMVGLEPMSKKDCADLNTTIADNTAGGAA